jgi:hypothetical protein
LKIGDAGVVTQNEIVGNDIGIQVLAYNPNSTFIDNNLICNNSVHNLENLTDKNFQVNLNCFCSQDSTVIENGILDGYDDITRGLVNYAIYDDSCQTILSYITKVVLEGGASLTEQNSLWNVWSADNVLHIISENPTDIQLFNSSGMCIFSGSLTTGVNTIPLTFSPGMYFITNTTGSRERFVIGM